LGESKLCAERILRERELLRDYIPVGRTKFRDAIAPRLVRVQLGPRCVGFTLSSVQKLIGELVDETPNAPKLMPAPNLRRRDAAAKPSKQKRRRSASK
jgi:hypothetical protein